MLVPDKKLVYSLYLVTAHTAPADLPGGANITTGASRTAIIEYSGVVVIAPDRQQLAAVEGGVVRDLLQPSQRDKFFLQPQSEQKFLGLRAQKIHVDFIVHISC